MDLPITVPLLAIELTAIVKADEKPSVDEGYKVVLIEDLDYTKLWLVYKLIQ